MFKITIPKPCFEGWENMLPNEQGRFCNSCAKTVVDFSVMSDEAVQQYLVVNYEKQVCGHFKNSQVQRIVIELPPNILHVRLPFWKKFLVLSLICFGTAFLSIDTTFARTSFIQGEPIHDTIIKSKTIKKHTGIKNDSPIKKILPRLRPDEKVDRRMMDGLIAIKEVHPPACDTSLAADTAVLVNNNIPVRKSKKNPLPEPPSPGNSFILPAALSVQNPSSKKKKA